MNEQDAWNNFLRSGSILDYLQYKSISNSNNESQGKTDENKDRRTYNKTSEYR